MKILKLLLLILTLLPYLAHSRTVENLNRSWQFTYGWEVRHGISTTVNIPHTWNTDALSGKQDYYRGIGNYQKNINIPLESKGKRLFLKFYGVGNIANIFINGKHACEHRGGYSAFTLEITNMVEYGKENTIMVRANNSPQLDVMPLLGDFNMYGGIYRNVELITTNKSNISLLDYGSSGVYLLQKEVTGKRANIEATVMTSTSESGLKVRIEVIDKDKIVAKNEVSVTVGENSANTLSLSIKNPRLWDGTTDPFTYTTRTSLVDASGKVIDSVEEPLGVRYFSVDPNKGVFLNGKHIQLKGVCRHQDRAIIGNALSSIHHQEDMDIMVEMGVNAIRLAHYQQSKETYNLCDKEGMIVWAEIPFIGPGGYRDKGFVDQPSFRENGKEQLIELIKQNFNHPSILFWGLFNELKEQGDNPCEYIAELNKLSKELDPSRLTTSASNQEGDLNRITDLIAWNKYYGWYGGDPSEIGVWADRAHKEFPNTPIGISEYGAGGSTIHQNDELTKTNPNSYWHPENWQTHFHIEHWKAIDSRPFLWGTFVWNMFDFGAAHRTEGDVPGINDKGLVTFDRAHKKDAFYFYKANWNKKEPFVYIAQRRNLEREKSNQQFMVFSNQPSVELIVNGKSYGKAQGDYGIFTWDNITLNKGENTVTASSDSCPNDTIIISH